MVSSRGAEEGGGGVGGGAVLSSYSELYAEAPPVSGAFFALAVYESIERFAYYVKSSLADR